LNTSLLRRWRVLKAPYRLGPRFPVCGGIPRISFNAMAQSLVQLNAPPDKRGHVIGLRKPPLSSELTLALVA
jgi:hypothetical protein